MTRTIKSQTKIDTHYFLTIEDETARACDCTCPDRYYRGKTCKHMRDFGTEYEKALKFNELRQKYDSRLNGQDRAQYNNFCLAMGI